MLANSRRRARLVIGASVSILGCLGLISGRKALPQMVSTGAVDRKQIDEVRSGGYHISQGDFRVHFSLAKETKADVTIRWPQGKIETYPGVAANQRIVVQEGKGIVARHNFAASQPAEAAHGKP